MAWGAEVASVENVHQITTSEAAFTLYKAEFLTPSTNMDAHLLSSEFAAYY